MLSLVSGKIHFDIDQCMQCGACIPICPTHSLSTLLLQNGLRNITCDDTTCTRCKICVRVCPVPPAIQSNFKYEEYLDNVQSVLGWSRDPQVRRMSSTGGIARTLIVEGLRSGIFDGAYSLIKTATFPFAEGKIIESANYTDIPNSIYHPVMTMENLQLTKKYRNFLVVGTSCQLATAEKLVRGKVDNLYRVCIFCKQQKTFNSTKALAKRLGEKNFEQSSFHISQYRGPDWPGTVQINTRSIPYDKAAALSFGRRLWQVPGCSLCTDPFGSDSDLSLMDPWGIETKGTPGKNLIFIATDKGKQLLQAFSSYIKIESIQMTTARCCISPSDLEYKRLFRERRKNGFKTGLPERLEKLQATTLEYLTSKFRFPTFVYKLLAHLPDVKTFSLYFYSNRNHHKKRPQISRL